MSKLDLLRNELTYISIVVDDIYRMLQHYCLGAIRNYSGVQKIDLIVRKDFHFLCIYECWYIRCVTDNRIYSALMRKLYVDDHYGNNLYEIESEHYIEKVFDEQDRVYITSSYYVDVYTNQFELIYTIDMRQYHDGHNNIHPDVYVLRNGNVIIFVDLRDSDYDINDHSIKYDIYDRDGMLIVENTIAFNTTFMPDGILYWNHHMGSPNALFTINGIEHKLQVSGKNRDVLVDRVYNYMINNHQSIIFHTDKISYLKLPIMISYMWITANSIYITGHDGYTKCLYKLI